MLLIPCCFNYIPIRKAFVKKKKEFGVTSTLYTFLLNELESIARVTSVCAQCEESTKVIAVITDFQAVDRVIDHLI